MKKLLLPFIFLFTIPFNTSCIHEITFKVFITGKYCSWEEPVKDAIYGKDYSIKIIPDPTYYLLDGDFVVKNKIHDLSLYHLYEPSTQTLTIPGEHVNSEITIYAEATQEPPGIVL